MTDGPAGEELVSAPYLLDHEAAKAYADSVESPPRYRRENIHSDAEAARRAGFAAPIAAGEHIYALVAQFLADRFGLAFLRGSRLAVTFIKPVLYGDRLTVHARPVRAGNAELEVWVENQRHERVLAGEARLGKER